MIKKVCSLLAVCMVFISLPGIAVPEWGTCDIVRTGVQDTSHLVKVRCPNSTVTWMELDVATEVKFATILTAFSLASPIKINFDQTILGAAGYPTVLTVYIDR